MKDHMRRSRLDAQTAFTLNALRARDGNRNARRAGTHGQEEWAFFEGQHAAVRRACAFYKGGHVHTLGQYTAGSFYALLRVYWAASAVHGDEIALPEAGSQDRHVHQRAFHEGRGAPRNQRDQRGRVEIGNVVGHEDARAVAWNALAALDVKAHPGHPATAGEHEARALVKRQHIARERAPWKSSRPKKLL